MFPDSAAVAVMSGSLTQRGEIALFSKYDRARIAVKCGVDAVFELPSVYSCAPANIFAYNAVYIAQKLSGIDYICFGSECGDLELLGFAAEKISDPAFEAKLGEVAKARKNNGYAKNVYELFCGLYGEKKASVLKGSNDILAIEYLKALKKLNSAIKPLTVKRTGADFKSAGFVRAFIRAGMTEKIKDFIPGQAYEAVLELAGGNKFTDISILSPAVIFRLCGLSAEEMTEYAGVPDICMARRIKKALDGCFDYDTLIEKLRAKHISPSSARRMTLGVFFCFFQKMQQTPPDFTVVLAASEKGRAFIGGIRKKAEIKIITKPADAKSVIYEKNLFIDNARILALRDKTGEINAVKQKPFLNN
jgi:predicted nucleotidyltransferase